MFEIQLTYKYLKVIKNLKFLSIRDFKEVNKVKVS